nr:MULTISPECIES: Hint domain-containing protein [unclassified Saccharibacter]
MYSCFLPGALIRTEEGDKPIESLQVGDRVCVGDSVEGLTRTRPVTRVLKHHVCVEKGRSSSFAGWPILIVKDAFSIGVPSQDLRVTAEHCFYFDGYFVPARMLVNGKTIRYDESYKEYDYHHIELDSHDVIWANDTLTESWLDTDTFFHQGDDGTWHPVSEDHDPLQAPTVDMSSFRKLEWGQDSAFPLAVERSFVEPLYHKLEARAVLLQRYSVEHISETLGAAQKDDGKESGVYLELEDGRRISPMKKRGRFLYFPIPDEAGSAVWLCSNVSQPSEMEGPFVDDRRYLGRLIGMISLWEGGQEIALTDHLTSDHLPGWFKREAGPYRWTNGHAVLRLPKRQPSTLTRKYTLVLEVVAGDCTEQESVDGQKVLAE